MIRHDLLAAEITGPSTCGYLGSYWGRGCAQGEPVKLRCPSSVSGRDGRIHIARKGAGRPSFMRRIGSDHCQTIPLDGVTGIPKFSSKTEQCGEIGNVMEQVLVKCEGKKQCTIQVNDNMLGNQDCPDVYKTFSVEYSCL